MYKNDKNPKLRGNFWYVGKFISVDLLGNLRIEKGDQVWPPYIMEQSKNGIQTIDPQYVKPCDDKNPYCHIGGTDLFKDFELEGPR